jgi:hypothetical protein
MLYSYIDDEIQQLNTWEGDVLHAYLDTDQPPNLTVGKGTLISTVDAMLALPWKHERTLAPATSPEIVQEWNRVKAMPGSMVAAAYASPYGLTLLASDVDALTEKTLLILDGVLRADFAGYDSFPDSVKTRLLDMAWNLGSVGLRTHYPRFDAAVEARNWTLAASECGRDTSDPSFNARNAWTRQGFLDAAAAVGV